MYQIVGKQSEFPKHGIETHQLLPWTPRIFAVLRVTSRLSKFLIPTLTFHTRRTFATFDSHLSSSLVTCDNVMDERTKITFNI